MVGVVSARTEPLSTVQVAQATGVTYRMLDHWCRCGYIDGQEPWTGSGSRRRWTPEQVARVEQLARASKIKSTRLDELADLFS